MHKDHNSTPSTRLLRRPPYGMPIRPRMRHDAANSLDWRKYSLPAAPHRSSPRGWRRAAKLLLGVGFSTCVVFSAWSVINSPLSSSGLGAVPTPTTPIAAVPSLPAPSTPTPSPTFSARSPAKSRPSSKQPKNRAVSSSRRRERGDVRSVSSRPDRRDVVPRPVRPRRTPEVRRAVPKVDTGKREGSLIAMKCDELFPPSVPAVRIQN